MRNHSLTTSKNIFRRSQRAVPLIAVVLTLGSLSACRDLDSHDFSLFDSGQGRTSLTIQDPDDEKFMASDEPYRLGVEHFNRGYYGKAAEYFQEAIERSPKDADAWISLAACYDQLRIFDLADKSYDYAIAIGGETPQLLNNQGYSYVLRGDLRKARQKFEQALEHDPDNIMVRNNLGRLDSREAS